MELIHKSTVVEDIRKLIEEVHAGRPFDSLSRDEQFALWYAKSILSPIDTLEVKEVDLDEEIEKCLKRHSMLAVGKKDFTDIAKHFFELGIKAQKGE